MSLRLRKRHFLSIVVVFTALCGIGWATLSAAEAPSALAASRMKEPRLAKKIVLIGGKKSHGPGLHDFQNGLVLIAAWLKAAPVFADANVEVYPLGWPADPAVLEGSDTVVCYFDGVQEKPEPLSAPERIALIQKLMDGGTGFIALHQASTVPEGDTSIPLVEWLGAKRNGMFDRTTEPVAFKPTTPDHPISAGMQPFTIRDEFYPTLIFHPQEQRITPVLRGRIGEVEPKQERVVAWAFERENGGRSFGYTGAHFIEVLSHPAIRQMLVNAIAWTAHIPVPKEGIALGAPVVARSIVTRPEDDSVIPMPWGVVRWFTSAEKGNSAALTTGVVTLNPGQSNPRHFHPNCDEVLHVISGKIRHTMNEVTVEMNAGDTVSIPRGVVHNATNIGVDSAILSISFSSAYREAVGEAAAYR